MSQPNLLLKSDVTLGLGHLPHLVVPPVRKTQSQWHEVRLGSLEQQSKKVEISSQALKIQFKAKQSSYSLNFQNSVDQIWTFSEGNRRILAAHLTKYIHFSEGIRRILAAQLTGMAHDCSQQLLRLCISQQSH